MELGDYIKHYRELNRWTCRDLAHKLGISDTQMSAIEKGRKRPSFKVYLAIIHYFKLRRNEEAKINEAYFISQYGDNFEIIKGMWQDVFFNEKGML